MTDTQGRRFKVELTVSFQGNDNGRLQRTVAIALMRHAQELINNEAVPATGSRLYEDGVSVAWKAGWAEDFE